VERNFTIMRLAASATSYMVVDHRVVNRGVPIETVERVTGKRPPTRFRIAMMAEPGAARVHRDVVSVFQPSASDLQTVRVATRNNAGLRPHGRLPPTLWGVGMPVALRTGPVGGDDDRQFRREQNELRSSQAREQDALEAIHHGEMAQWQLRAETQTTSKREAVEAQALRDQHRGAEQQLQTRQQIRLQAARASAATNGQKRNPPVSSPASTTTDPGR
jgi:hypothetical protein